MMVVSGLVVVVGGGDGDGGGGRWKLVEVIDRKSVV